MARGKNAVLLGPWPGGINQRDDPSEIADSELVDIVNFDVESTGALIPRRGWQEFAVTAPVQQMFPLTVYYDQLSLPSAVFARWTSVVGGAEETAFFRLGKTLFSGGNLVYGDLKDAANATYTRAGWFVTAFGYNKQIFFVPDSRSEAAGVGFSLNDVLSSQDPVDVPDMPAGKFSFIMGDRAFIFDPFMGRLYWSKATDPTIWAAPDGGYVDVEPSDEPFTDCVVVRNTVYLLRSNGIFSFTFTSDPGIDGLVTTLSNTEGATLGVPYQNELILLTPRGIFKFVNGYLALLTDKIPFGVLPGAIYSYSDNNGMTVIEHTLWVKTYDGVNLHHFAVNLHTGAVSRYDHTNLAELPGKGISDAEYTYFPAVTIEAGVAHFNVAAIKNKRSATFVTANGKDFGYSFSTKRITFGTRLIWKRLISWLVDYNAGSQFDDGNNDTKFLVRANASGEFIQQVVYTGEATVTAASKEGRIDTPSIRFKDIQFGLQCNQAGNNNPSGINAEAGITVRGIMLFYSTSRETVSIQT